MKLFILDLYPYGGELKSLIYQVVRNIGVFYQDSHYYDARKINEIKKSEMEYVQFLYFEIVAEIFNGMENDIQTTLLNFVGMPSLPNVTDIYRDHLMSKDFCDEIRNFAIQFYNKVRSKMTDFTIDDMSFQQATDTYAVFIVDAFIRKRNQLDMENPYNRYDAAIMKKLLD